jgi:hypothetical protein
MPRSTKNWQVLRKTLPHSGAAESPELDTSVPQLRGGRPGHACQQLSQSGQPDGILSSPAVLRPVLRPVLIITIRLSRVTSSNLYAEQSRR